MVRLAKARGVEAVSLTSNGTLAPERYLELIAAGLTELRVSLDAKEALLGARLTNRPGAFFATVRTLEALAAARRNGLSFTLIINTVVGLQNRQTLPELLRFLLRFGPDDVKLITEVDEKHRLGDFPEAPAVRAAVEAMLQNLPAQALPLLRRKLETVFARHAIGLEQTAPAPFSSKPWRCYIPLTERTVDRVSYYPCSVYLREGGKPLGSLEDSPEVQRERSAQFTRESDCLSDPICRKYCLHCTRSFNERANEVRK
jgi:MoaA/NifB/PqqE/SkfB family radical SAM enzyme